MAEAPREILRRIRGIKSTQQITKAMEMVAAVKLNRVRAQAESARPFVENIKMMMQSLCLNAGEIDHPLFEERPINKVFFVVITSDRGLCGTFNTNLINAAAAFIDEQVEEGKEVSVITIGRKGTETLTRMGYNVILSHEVPWGDAIVTEMNNICVHLRQSFVSGQCDAVYVLYSKFENVLRHVPTTIQYLPVPQLAEEEKKALLKMSADFIIEPNFEEMAGMLTPRYLETQLYHGQIETLASEYAARMVAMRNANDNAEEVIADLTLSYNKARQASITTELIDIIGGAEALQG